MKQIAAFSLFAVLLAFALPLLLYLPGRSAPADTPQASPAPDASPSPAPTAAAQAVLDASIALEVQTDAGTAAMSMADYLPLALAGEMPASFEPEALKAQAVALRSYALYYRANRKAVHPEADVCSSAGCCAALAEESALRSAWGAQYENYRQKLADAADPRTHM